MVKKPNILVVDDDESNIFLVRRILNRLDVNIIFANSGKVALEKIKDTDVALALLDIMMPEMDGIELAKRIQHDKSRALIPIIFITALEKDEAELQECYDAGAVDFILKPIIKSILLSKVNVFLELYRQKQQIIAQKAEIENKANELEAINASLKYRLSYESMLSKISGMAVLVDELDDFLGASVTLLGESNNVSRTYIFRYNHESETIDNTHEWCNKGITPQKENLQAVPGNHIPYWTESLKSGKILNFSDIEAIPDEGVKEILRSQNILSILAVPMFIEASYYGFIGFDDCLFHKEWLSEDVTFLVAITRIVASVIARKQSENAIMRKVTKLKQAEKTLRMSEQKYRTMINALPDGIFLISLKGIITEVSEIGLELLEMNNQSELIGNHFFRLIPPDEKPIVKNMIYRTLEEGLIQNVEIRIRNTYQKVFMCESSLSLIQNDDGEPLSFLVTIRDISQRKKLEQMQIHASRMASLGEMATGIAHEINQPLNIISIALDNLVLEADTSHSVNKQYLLKKTDRIFENIDRMKNIIDHVRSFSRNQDDYILTGFSVNDSINNALSMISEQLKHSGISLEISLLEGLPQIIGNTFKLEQVILNLISNAKDTLLEKNNSVQHDFEMSIQISSYRENGNLVIEVTDNGMGISNHDADMVMMPFYSTKDAGKGTGLGLSISYQIVKEMNGTIELESRINEGTTFRIVLNVITKKHEHE